ncbi:DUF177 domain-containing protein [Temperatibacter marinus]|uniref:DUF177 domain-containing protein n=1 Tax=Temperatibacter marinus TaxID=1456591 RepID=A0AA52HA09_9PROT|nr:DUF177 domain-containing protein [Temperatibacter marinus]WND02240.1 DUF177 domain-containing protein [Temperatibacter marinus]
MKQPILPLTTLVPLGDLSAGQRTYHLDCNPTDFTAIAERLHVHEVHSIFAQVTVEDKGRTEGIKLEGLIKTTLSQICVISHEPFELSFESHLNLRLIGGEELARLDEAEAYLDPEFDEYDELMGNEIDLAEILIQTISMDIDPYARSIEIEDLEIKSKAISINEGPEKKPNPFAALEKLKNKT